jgi:hypothetical protein
MNFLDKSSLNAYNKSVVVFLTGVVILRQPITPQVASKLAVKEVV